METLDKVSMSPTAFDSRANYIGETEFPGLYVLMGRNRDSDLLTNCNWDIALEMLGGEGKTVVVHSFGHWAVGWIEYLCVAKASPAFKLAEEIEEKLSNYPILNEDKYSEIESQEYNNNFDPRDFADYLEQEFKEAGYPLSDLAVELIGEAGSELGVFPAKSDVITFFESLIPSGDYHSEGYSNYDYAAKECTRDQLAKFIKEIRLNNKIKPRAEICIYEPNYDELDS